MADVIFQHKLDKLVAVYENDKDLTAMLKFYDLYLPDVEEGVPLQARIDQYEKILTVFDENSAEISEATITELLTNTDIRNEIDIIMYQSAEPITDDMYRQFLYSYKYGTIKTFFINNHENFTPSYDAQVLQDSEKMRLWQDAFMREFDKFAEVIDNIIEVQDVDIIAEEYLDYMAQLVGFERGDTFLKDSLFREITKNIIEIYRIKGTNYSFELFFNFIGFDINVIEYWFDKRFYFSNYLANPHTGETDRSKFGFYLTPVKPTEGIPGNISSIKPFGILGNELTSIRNGLSFDKDLEGGSIDKLEEYLWVNQVGEPDMQSEQYYSYFKTNIVEYSISKIESEDASLSEEDVITIEAYTVFLTPIFVSKKVVVTLIPWLDTARNVLIMSDKDLTSEDEHIAMFMATILGTMIIKVGLDIDGDEVEQWSLDYTDTFYSYPSLVSPKYIEDLNELQIDPLYNDLGDSLDAFSEVYPFLDNKPNKSTDFAYLSNESELMSSTLYHDSLMMLIKSTDYRGYGEIITGGITVTSGPLPLPPTASFASYDVQITGAGISGVNGDYVASGTHTSGATYYYNGEYYLYFHSLQYRITTDPPSTSSNPPTQVYSVHYGNFYIVPEGAWGGAGEPVIEIGQSIYGPWHTGDEDMRAIYQYSGSNPEGVTTFQWFLCDDEIGTNDVAIPGANSIIFEWGYDHDYHYLRCEITPVDNLGGIGSTISTGYQYVEYW